MKMSLEIMRTILKISTVLIKRLNLEDKTFNR